MSAPRYERIAFRDGYKYQLVDAYCVATDLRPTAPIDTRWITLALDGTLTIREGYAWDGPSGPTVDSSCFMRGSLAHDAIYQLIREGALDASWKDTADRMLQRMCREDGMTRLRAWWVYQGVARFGRAATLPSGGRPVRYAP